MKRLPLHALALLCVSLHSGYCSEGKRRCEHMLVRVGENVTIKCSITNPDQDGVYLYTQREETSKEETVLYYYGLKQTLTPETPYKDRVETNRDFGDFSVSIRNVSKHDMGFYWCRFNKLNINTVSTETFLFVQPEIIHTCKEEGDIKEYKEECVWKKFAYILAGMFIFTLIILVVVLVRMCTDRRNDTPRRQPSNGVYEVMRSNTMTALTNPAYESSKKRIQSQSC